MEKGKLFIISAPTGVGKTTLVKEALKRIEDTITIERVVTYTLRKPRNGEIDGVHYHFISPEEFNNKVHNGFFLETSTYHAQEYGSPASLLDDLEEGKSLILIVDRNGTRTTLNAVRNAVTIFISAPSLETIKQRLISRGTETQEKIKQRLAIAKEDMDLEKKQPLYRYHIINDVFEEAARELIHIITSEEA